ncbi:hypothetical protein IOD13_07170 [Brevibacterium casei]|nr:hypothetical protein [Brevibacterium casei]
MPRSRAAVAVGESGPRMRPAWTNPGARKSPSRFSASGSRARAASSEPMKFTVPSAPPRAVAKGSTSL